MSDSRIPDDVMEQARDVVTVYLNPSRGVDYEFTCHVAARAILAERNRVHKQLKGEAE